MFQKLFDSEQRLYMHCKKGTNMNIITWCACGATINQQLSFLSVVTGSHFLPQASGAVINHPSSTIELSFRACYFYVNDLTGTAKPVNGGEKKNAKEIIQSYPFPRVHAPRLVVPVSLTATYVMIILVQKNGGVIVIG